MSKSEASFVLLHAHTTHSTLDGIVSADAAAAKAAADGQPALAITDHGNMSGVPDLHTACKKHGIHPIFGIEAYMAFESVDERPAKKGSLKKAAEPAPAHGACSHASNGLCLECSGVSTVIPTEEKAAANVMSEDTGESDSEGRKQFYHLLLLAENEKGYENIAKLSSRSYREGFYRKPRIDWSMLEDHNEGVIATTGCLGSVVQQALLRGDYREALGHASRLRDIFGEDNLYVEMQDHGIRAQHLANPHLVRLAQDLQLPLVATNDFHYLDEADHEAHDAALALQTGKPLSDPNRFRFEGRTNFVKTSREMRNGTFAMYGSKADWESEDNPNYTVERACDNTLLIAKRVVASGFELPFDKGFHLPSFPDEKKTKPEMSDAEYLRYRVLEGAKERYGQKLNDKVRSRIDYELTVIEQMGFSSYFLITMDICEACDRMGYYRGPGRGSAAGAIVAYTLDITMIDPIFYELPFERFLNPDRVSMPDIDLDFETVARGPLMDYTRNLYGDDRVAQIITFSEIQARGALRDAARILDVDNYARLGGELASAVPPNQAGKGVPLAAVVDQEVAKSGVHLGEYAYEHGEAFRKLAASGDAQKVTNLALSLAGLTRQDGRHAAAIVISDEPLDKYVPTKNVSENGGRSPQITQFEMKPVEGLGLLKMDYLALANLDAMHIAVDQIRRHVDPEFDIYKVPLGGDAKTFDLLASGQTIGVFQLESEGMRRLLVQSGPTHFDDIPAILAFYRPGPMDAGAHEIWAQRKSTGESWEPLLPILETCDDILDPTLGLIAYQEQVMQIAQRVAGYSGAEADDLRRAMGKKIDSLMDKHESQFMEGAKKNGHSEEQVQKLFDLLKPFADYGFSKNHAVPYGAISYWTAYLKANYPWAFFTGMVAARSGDKKGKIANLLRDARSMGVKTLPPSVRNGDPEMVATPPTEDAPYGALRFGWNSISNIGDGVAGQMLASFGEGVLTPETIEDALLRLCDLSQNLLEALTYAGLFDEFGVSRSAVIQTIPMAKRIYANAKKRVKKAKQEETLFGSETQLKVKLDSMPQTTASIIRKISPTEAKDILESLDSPNLMPLHVELSREVAALSQFVTIHPFDVVKRQVREERALIERDGEEALISKVALGAWSDQLVYVDRWNVREVKSGPNAGKEWASAECTNLYGEELTVNFGSKTWTAFLAENEKPEGACVMSIGGKVQAGWSREDDPDGGGVREMWANQVRVLDPTLDREGEIRLDALIERLYSNKDDCVAVELISWQGDPISLHENVPIKDLVVESLYAAEGKVASVTHLPETQVFEVSWVSPTSLVVEGDEVGTSDTWRISLSGSVARLSA